MSQPSRGPTSPDAPPDSPVSIIEGIVFQIRDLHLLRLIALLVISSHSYDAGPKRPVVSHSLTPGIFVSVVAYAVRASRSRNRCPLGQIWALPPSTNNSIPVTKSESFRRLALYS